MPIMLDAVSSAAGAGTVLAKPRASRMAATFAKKDMPSDTCFLARCSPRVRVRVLCEKNTLPVPVQYRGTGTIQYCSCAPYSRAKR